MQELANTLIENGTQCWACPVFDSLFAVISNTAAAAYNQLVTFSVIIFCILFAFYIINAVWQNIKSGGTDSFLNKNIKPVLIKSLIAVSLLSAGLLVPRLISSVTFEPAALITLGYAQSMLPPDTVITEYADAINLGNDGFFNPALRDTIIKLIETSLANFQVYIKIGIGILDSAFSLDALLGLGAVIRHLIVFIIGLFLTYNFGKLFIKYSFCFMDIIVAMAMFAFFFPLSVIFFIFKDDKSSPGWMKKLGGDLGSGQIKKLVNAIVSVAATILTYTIIMLIIKGFLDSNGVDTNSITNAAESLFEFDLENSSAMEITFAGAIVLVYIIRFIAKQVPKVTEKIMEAFGVSKETQMSDEMGENMWALTTIIGQNAKQLVSNVSNPEAAKTNAETTNKTETETKTTETKEK